MIEILKIDDVHIKVNCEDDVAYELSEYFTFAVPGAKFSPAFRNKLWDGKIRLFNKATRYLYTGLFDYVVRFAKERDYSIEYDSNIFDDESFSLVEAYKFIESLNLTLAPRDYQLEGFVHAIRKHRALLLSPTASGKSLMIYLISRYYQEKSNNKVLIIVPTTSLVHQMASDFVDYGFNDDDIHKIFSGQEKLTDSNYVITTWQSIYKLPKPWFSQFSCVIGDEAHLFKSKSLTTIMSKMPDCPARFGFTGTLDGTQAHKLVLEGVFGSVRKIISTAELIEQKHLSNFRIKAITLSYNDEVRKHVKQLNYQGEIDYINSNVARNNFICNLTLSLENNSLLLFKIIDHGKLLFDHISSKCTDRKVFYVDGSVDGMLREDIRRSVEVEKNAIIIASLGTFSTGVNIKNLHNIIFASPSKSRIKTLQSIGRGLRLSNNKEIATLYDLNDDLTWKSRKNYTLLHFLERVKMYDDEKFDYKIYNVNIRS